jgi:Ca2+-binding EF-hand superfamily protein
MNFNLNESHNSFISSQAAKSAVPAQDKGHDDFVEFKEFRLFLMYLRQYIELYIMFKRIDVDNTGISDHRIDIDEFKNNVELLNRWGAKIVDAEDSFKEADSDGGGKILFDEFAAWAIKRGLDLDDDDDAEFVDVGKRGESNLSRKEVQKSLSKKPTTPTTMRSNKSTNTTTITTPMKSNQKKNEPTKSDWIKLTSLLCYKKTAEHATARQRLFKKMDVNGNGMLSLAEIEKGIREELKLPEQFESKAAVLRAFQVKNIYFDF